jgi:integrase/recombinase XerD
VSKNRGDQGDPGQLHSLAALLTDHLGALESRGYAPATVSARRNYLGHFLNWLSERGITRADQVTLAVLERYRLTLFRTRKSDGTPLGRGSQAQKLLAIKGLFKWLTRLRHIGCNPAAELDLPRGPKRIPRTVLSASEAERVMIEPDLVHPLGIRDRAILELLYSTGIRRAECCGLDVSDIDLVRLVVLVREGKGGRDRYVPLGARAALWLDKYLLDVRPRYRVEPDDGALFLNRHGKRLPPKRLGTLVRDYIAAADIGKTGSCHVFRHTMATLMLDGGADVRHIQEILGHAELSTTALYTHISIGQLQDVHRRTHPAGRSPDTDA